MVLLGGAFPLSSAFGQEAAKDPRKIIESWEFPGANKGRDFFASATQSNPYVAVRTTASPYKDVWEFYAKKCGFMEQYQEGVQRNLGGEDKDGSYTIISYPKGNALIGARCDNRACFTRATPSYVMTVLICTGKDLKQNDAGANIEMICVAR